MAADDKGNWGDWIERGDIRTGKKKSYVEPRTPPLISKIMPKSYSGAKRFKRATTTGYLLRRRKRNFIVNLFSGGFEGVIYKLLLALLFIALLVFLYFYSLPAAIAVFLIVIFYFIAKKRSTSGSGSPQGASQGALAGGGSGGSVASSSTPSPYKKGYGEEAGEILAREKYKHFGGLLFFRLRRAALPIILIVSIIFVILLFWNPDLRAATISRSELFAEKIGLERAVGYPLTWITYIRESAAGVRKFDTRPGYQAEEVKGVTIKGFDFLTTDVNEGDEIQLQGEVNIDALEKDDANIVFGCYLDLEDNKTKEGKATIGGMSSDTNSMTVHKGKSERKFVYCNIPGVEVSGTFETFKAYMTWKYEGFVTQTRLRAYTQKSEVKEKLYDKGKDPLEGLKGSDDVDYDGYAKDNCVRGCGLTDLGMQVGSLLPLSENTINYLDVKLFGLSSWYGELKKLHYINLEMPPQLKEKDCTAIGEDLILDGNDEYFVKANEKLEKGNKITVAFRCGIDVADAGNSDDPMPATIIATAKYDYGGKKQSSSLVYVRGEGVSSLT